MISWVSLSASVTLLPILPWLWHSGWLSPTLASTLYCIQYLTKSLDKQSRKLYIFVFLNLHINFVNFTNKYAHLICCHAQPSPSSNSPEFSYIITPGHQGGCTASTPTRIFIIRHECCLVTYFNRNCIPFFYFSFHIYLLVTGNFVLQNVLQYGFLLYVL